MECIARAGIDWEGTGGSMSNAPLMHNEQVGMNAEGSHTQLGKVAKDT